MLAGVWGLRDMAPLGGWKMLTVRCWRDRDAVQVPPPKQAVLSRVSTADRKVELFLAMVGVVVERYHHCCLTRLPLELE
jgi:hypothetical protein